MLYFMLCIALSFYQDWDKLKGRYRPEQKGYFMQAKQRFRAALYKLSTVEQLSSPDKHVKHYRLCLNKKNEVIRKYIILYCCNVIIIV